MGSRFMYCTSGKVQAAGRNREEAGSGCVVDLGPARCLFGDLSYVSPVPRRQRGPDARPVRSGKASARGGPRPGPSVRAGSEDVEKLLTGRDGSASGRVFLTVL